jgi:hypothetical protein
VAVLDGFGIAFLLTLVTLCIATLGDVCLRLISSALCCTSPNFGGQTTVVIIIKNKGTRECHKLSGPFVA